MKNLTWLHSNIDSLLVSHNIDHHVRNDIKKLMKRKDSEYISIDQALEIIDEYATYIFGNGLSEANQIALWDGMRNKVLTLKGG